MTQEYIWETFDEVFKAIQKQDKRVEELEEKIRGLESRLNRLNAPQLCEPVIKQSGTLRVSLSRETVEDVTDELGLIRPSDNEAE